MVKVTVLVEGAGQNNALKTLARENLLGLIRKLQLSEYPSIEFHGTRRAAFDRLKNELRRSSEDRFFILLVDSEEPFYPSPDPNEIHHRWAHVRNRSGDNWIRPNTATDENLHFMATAMETWIVADKEAIRSRFPRDFRENAIRNVPDWEQRPKDEVMGLLRSATAERSRKGCYQKGKISFELLGLVNPQTLRANCPHANLFFLELERRLGCEKRS